MSSLAPISKARSVLSGSANCTNSSRFSSKFFNEIELFTISYHGCQWWRNPNHSTSASWYFESAESKLSIMMRNVKHSFFWDGVWDSYMPDLIV